ncbi:MAG TPA: histidine--tRNA ligase [Patescibacteria group bacterium]|nr:histidine--tRNA ligase [Patescibacteria group bacterium]
MPRITNKPIQLLKGFKDTLPEQQAFWDNFLYQAERVIINYGFKKIDVPVLEQSMLYYKGTGKHTDIVTKELYSFEDKGGENVTLRPEFTPGICRSYIEHGMFSKPQPVKLYSYGPVFRHDNPQSGRYRQFTQLDLEVIGSDSPVIDAQLIIISYRILEALGLPPVVHVNSIGCLECRTAYIAKLKQYLSSSGKKKGLCEICKDRYNKNPLRILDCKEEPCQRVLDDAPQIVDSLCEDCKKHFMQVLEYLDDMGIEYTLDVKLVRGLDYYNRTTFEVFLQEENNQTSISLLGGGRFDGLVEILGGRPTPAAGLAIGVERVVNKLRELHPELQGTDGIDVFVAQLGTEARKEGFKLYEKLISENIRVAESFSKDGLKAQLEKADTLHAKLTLIIGQKELMDHTIIIRDMSSGIQEIVNYDKALSEVKKRLDPNINTIKSYRLDSIKIGEKTTDSSVTPPLAPEPLPVINEYKIRHSDDNINSHEGFSDADYDLEDELDDDLDEEDDDLEIEDEEKEEKDYHTSLEDDI